MGSKSQEIIGLHGIESLSTLLGARPAAALGHFLQGFADEFGAALLEVGSAQGAIAIRDWLVAHTACRQEALLDLHAADRPQIRSNQRAMDRTHGPGHGHPQGS